MDVHGPDLKSTPDPSQVPLLPPLPYPQTHHDQAASIKKRRPSGPGSRGVANLNPDQLAKKRANDREAQRAIRERTRNQIESLERKIRELTAQQPYQDLQHVIRQKEMVEAENEEIKKRLNSVVSILQPLLSGQSASGTVLMLHSDPWLLHGDAVANQNMKKIMSNLSIVMRMEHKQASARDKMALCP